MLHIIEIDFPYLATKWIVFRLISIGTKFRSSGGTESTISQGGGVYKGSYRGVSYGLLREIPGVLATVRTMGTK